jgi:hypothetical protein
VAAISIPIGRPSLEIIRSHHATAAGLANAIQIDDVQPMGAGAAPDRVVARLVDHGPKSVRPPR